MKNLFSLVLCIATGVVVCAQARNLVDGDGFSGQKPETLQSIAQQFAAPSDAYKPHVWWHWLGSNYSREGVTKDLQAMKESGIGGVVIFNAPSWLDPEQNPWPRQTYRSEAYWDVLGHALAEAKRLNMTVGIHNSPGWSTTGGPWISPEQGMQRVAFRTVKTGGAKTVTLHLPEPEIEGKAAGYYKDEAVMAVRAGEKLSSDDILDISAYFVDGALNWQAPEGEWTIYRFGYCPTMQRSHPAPEDVADISFEADKMNTEATVIHWNHVLNPLKERFEKYIGTTFQDIWIDSYEAWGQNWSVNFRQDFIRMKGYDPVKQIILAYERGDDILDKQSHGIQEMKDHFSPESNVFLKDYAEVIHQLFLNCWQTGKEMIHRAGFRFCFEPYGSIVDAPFDMVEGIAIADIPVTEFWVHSREISGGELFAKAAAKYRKRIVGAEAFTGMERTCTYTETPAMLKYPADMGYSQGVNHYFLHSWAHNPWDDSFRPGWGFAHYGTHFSRNQTWFEPGKAFFTYLARCQMLLQQGSFISSQSEYLHRRTPDADIFFVRNTGEAAEKQLTFPVTERIPELWDAYTGMIGSTHNWIQKKDGTTVTLRLEKNESLFVIFPCGETAYSKQPEIETVKETFSVMEGSWTITFIPKTGHPSFRRTFPKLLDFSRQNDEDVKYFSGTAVYEQKIKIKDADLKNGKRITIDLGEVYDMAELEINGAKAGVLWLPPFRADITSFLKAGQNTLKISVTNTWVNRLIGDEQYPEDFEWTDKNQGLRAMKGLPEWFVRGLPRPTKERKAFTPWYYFGKDSPLQPAGLLGPVRIDYRDVRVVGHVEK
jgi:hypothetical protein